MKTNKQVPLIFGVANVLIAIFFVIEAVRINSWIISLLIGGIFGVFFFGLLLLISNLCFMQVGIC
jgi:hypothetical protein